MVEGWKVAKDHRYSGRRTESAGKKSPLRRVDRSRKREGTLREDLVLKGKSGGGDGGAGSHWRPHGLEVLKEVNQRP